MSSKKPSLLDQRADAVAEEAGREIDARRQEQKTLEQRERAKRVAAAREKQAKRHKR